jgi:hypothetical protein
MCQKKTESIKKKNGHLGMNLRNLCVFLKNTPQTLIRRRIIDTASFLKPF